MLASVSLLETLIAMTGVMAVSPADPPSAVVDGYLWPEGVSPESWTGFRRQVSSTDRAIEHVAPEEIGNAMAALCRASAGMMADELLTPAEQVVLRRIAEADLVQAGRLPNPGFSFGRTTRGDEWPLDTVYVPTGPAPSGYPFPWYSADDPFIG